MTATELATLYATRAGDDSVLARLGRHCTASFLLEAGDACLYFEIERGRVTQIIEGKRHLRSWQFALRGSEATWQAFWQPMPAPGFNDIFALARFGHLTLEGDMRPLLAHLRFFKRLLALPRGREPRGAG